MKSERIASWIIKGVSCAFFANNRIQYNLIIKKYDASIENSWKTVGNSLRKTFTAFEKKNSIIHVK